MSFLSEFAIATLILGLAVCVISMICTIYMFIRSSRNVYNNKATELDVAFLIAITPGKSKIALFNGPDTLGLGIITSLALEQVGAIQDMATYAAISLRLYPNTVSAYLLAARRAALVGDTQRMQHFLEVAGTMRKSGLQRGKGELSLLSPDVITRLTPIESRAHSEDILRRISSQPLKNIVSHAFQIDLISFFVVIVSLVLVVV